MSPGVYCRLFWIMKLFCFMWIVMFNLSTNTTKRCHHSIVTCITAIPVSFPSSLKRSSKLDIPWWSSNSPASIHLVAMIAGLSFQLFIYNNNNKDRKQTKCFTFPSVVGALFWKSYLFILRRYYIVMYLREWTMWEALPGFTLSKLFILVHF